MVKISLCKCGKIHIPLEIKQQVLSGNRVTISILHNSKGLVKNVLKHGCGGINIDGCRIGLSDAKRPDTLDLCISCANGAENSSIGSPVTNQTSAASSVMDSQENDGSTTHLDGSIKRGMSGSNIGTTKSKNTSTSLNTGMSGGNPLRKGTSCTTLTKTGQTTGLKICNMCGQRITLNTTKITNSGRFPANLVLSHNEDCVEIMHIDEENIEDPTKPAWVPKMHCTHGCAVAMLDEQSGQLHPRGNITETLTADNGMFGNGIIRNNAAPHANYKDSGGASRFFFNCKPDKMDDVWQDQRLSNYADSVVENLKVDVQQAFTVLEAALKKVDLEDKQLKSTIARFMSEMPKLLANNEETTIKTIQSTAKKFLQELQPINTLNKDLAISAEIQKLIDTMRIILSLLMLDFFVENVTLPIMPNSLELGEKDLKGNRFIYCAKASKADKNAGCEEMDSKQVGDGPTVPADNAFQRGKTLRQNTHPTVKSTKLMSYLIKLVTPPGGIVLDPFTGSGTTGVSAIKEGFSFIGVEQNEEYFKIAQARLDHEEKIKSGNDTTE